jgi:ribonuclease BN (tRNA processing enzyme)
MKAVFLGTNGWYSTAIGNTSCVLLDTENYYVVFDAGDGLYKLNKYVHVDKPIILFLSHLHLDHIIGFHVLNKFRFSQGIAIYGYEGTGEGLRIVGHPYTAPLNQLPTKVTVHNLTEGKHYQPFPFTCKLLVHADQCLGYRIELDKKTIAYCTDTGICKSIYELTDNADLLITECSLKPMQKVEWIGEWPHLRPEDAANIAREAHVKKLVLTHFDAGNYISKEDRKHAEAVARKIFRETVAVFDDDKIEI